MRQGKARAVIAVVGQSVVDRVKLPGRPWVERLGGAPIFAGQALAAAGAPGVILTRGATPELRAPLRALGFRVIEGPARRSCVSEMVLSPDGACADSFGDFGDPFTPADVAGWMAPGLAEARTVVCGAQWSADFSEATLAALARGRSLYLDGQGPLRAAHLGPLRLEGPLPRSLLRHVAVLKLAEEEAQAALGGIDASAARTLGVPVVVVTLGERGAVVLADGATTAVPVDPVRDLADTIGAGDAFLALMAAASADGATPVEAARFACAGTAAMLRRRRAETHGVTAAPFLARPAAILFDFGGTLDADGVTWKERAFALFRDEDLLPPASDFDRIFYAADDALTGVIPPTLPFADTVLRLFTGVAKGLGLSAPDAVGARLATRFLDDARARLQANASLLRRLAGRYRLGVVSNFYGNLTTVCEETGVRPYFAVLVDSTRVGSRKPDPAIFRHALDALGVAPGAALFVGDSPGRDMAGARGVGMPHLWLVPIAARGAVASADRADGLCCPEDRLIHSLGELEGLLS